MNLKWGNVQLPGVCKELFYWSAVPLPCSARAYLSLKEWQKRRAREKKRGKRERGRRDADRKGMGSSMVTSGSLLNYRCHDMEIKIKSLSPKAFSTVIHNEKGQKKKKMKGKNRWWVVSKTVVYVLVLNCRTVYCKLSADLIIQIKQLGSTDV